MEIFEERKQLVDVIKREKRIDIRNRTQAKLAAFDGDVDLAKNSYRQFLGEFGHDRLLIRRELAALGCLARSCPERQDIRSLAIWLQDSVNSITSRDGEKRSIC